MDLVANHRSRGCWVEVRPLITSNFESANFAPILDALHNFGTPFRFFIVAPQDGSEGVERALVRFFLQFSDEQTRVQMTNIIRTFLDVEVVGDIDPPTPQYHFCTDLELSKNYALPIVFKCQRRELMVNLIDRLVATTAGLGVCVEVTAKADPNATLGIQKFVYDKLSHKSSATGGANILEPFVDLIGTGIGKDPKNETSAAVRDKHSGQKVDFWSRELVKHAELKLTSNLFTCKILILGNSLQTIGAVKNALPASPTNRFKTFKTTQTPQCPATALRAPSRHAVRNNALCRLWWAIPLSMLLFAWGFGLFNPLKLVSSASMPTLDWGIIVLGVFVAVCLFVAFRRRNAIVLSTQELAQIVGLPTAVEKLPVALGKVALSRMQLGSKTTSTKEEEKKMQATKSVSFETKEETAKEQTQEHSSLPTAHRLPTVLEEVPTT